MLPAVRTYCAKNPDIFHYEVEEIGQIAKALEMIARVKPKVLVINGGDGTVRDVLTAGLDVFGEHWPALAVLPKGKTNALNVDLGAPAGWSLAMLLPFALLALWWAVGRGLAPLAALQARIRARAPDDMSPIDPKAAPEEISPVVASFNELLERLSRNMQMQQRFLDRAFAEQLSPMLRHHAMT